MNAKKVGRPKIGQPISVTLTEKQREWLEAQREDGEPLTIVVRRIITRFMQEKEPKETTSFPDKLTGV